MDVLHSAGNTEIVIPRRAYSLKVVSLTSQKSHVQSLAKPRNPDISRGLIYDKSLNLSVLQEISSQRV